MKNKTILGNFISDSIFLFKLQRDQKAIYVFVNEKTYILCSFYVWWCLQVTNNKEKSNKIHVFWSPLKSRKYHKLNENFIKFRSHMQLTFSHHFCNAFYSVMFRIEDCFRIICVLRDDDIKQAPSQPLFNKRYIFLYLFKLSIDLDWIPHISLNKFMTLSVTCRYCRCCFISLIVRSWG